MSRSLALASLLFAGVASAQSSSAPQTPAAAPQAPAAAEPSSAAPAPVAPEEPKRKGQVYTWFSAGSTFAYGATYGNVNLGAGYILPSGLAPNVELGYAFGHSPAIWSFRPGLTYFLPIPVISPYIGAFYTRWFVGDGLADENGVGGRAGVSLGRVLSLGVIYDHMLGCNADCDSWAPILSASASF